MRNNQKKCWENYKKIVFNKKNEIISVRVKHITIEYKNMN